MYVYLRLGEECRQHEWHCDDGESVEHQHEKEDDVAALLEEAHGHGQQHNNEGGEEHEDGVENTPR